MIEMGLFQQARLDQIKQALGVYARRHRVVADNIANVETPDYRAQEYRFEEYLDGAKRKLQGLRTHSQHLPIGRREVGQTQGHTASQETAYDNGVNNVDIDKEMADLTTNDLAYRLATRLLSMKYNVLHGAITGRLR